MAPAFKSPFHFVSRKDTKKHFVSIKLTIILIEVDLTGNKMLSIDFK